MERNDEKVWGARYLSKNTVNANLLQVNVKVVTPHKNEKEINVILSVQKKEHGFELTSAFTHGQHKLDVDGKFDMQPNNWNINIKVQFIHLYLFYSNKSPTSCNNFPVLYPDICPHLNMFRAFSRPSSGAQ
jgi:hypothetical protein